MKYTHTGVANLFLSTLLAIALSDDSVIVNTAVGDVEGIWKFSHDGTPVRVFYGIPYATPPVGRRRYRPPEPAQHWNGVLNCTKPTGACVQKRFSLLKTNAFIERILGVAGEEPTEDCLKLNIFVPKTAKPKSPVMFWIHGGGFALGTSAVSMYDACTLAAQENVVVVTINYRLASFGFLYLGLDGAPGNVGLMDQAMALEWVHHHISNFNGDPNEVTAFGQSAGSTSLAFLQYQESSRNLFKRAILQSGTGNAPFSFDTKERQLRATKEFAFNIGCPFSKSDLNATLECFLSKDATDLIENEPTWGYAYIFFYRPVLDGKYITKHPLDETRKSNKEFISGTMKDDSTLFFSAFYPIKFPFRDNIKPLKEDLYQVLTEFFGLNNITANLMLAIYSDVHDKDGAGSTTSMARRMGTDGCFYCPAVNMEKVLVRNGNKVYKYFFTEEIKSLGLPNWYGAFHGSDVIYAFGDPFRDPSKYNEADRNFSRRIMNYWGNFARTGNPNILPNGQEMEIYWPETNTADGTHLIMAANSTSTGSKKANRYCKFWNDIVPKLLENSDDSGVITFRRQHFF